jgi:chromosome segregation ATPase
LLKERETDLRSELSEAQAAKRRVAGLANETEELRDENERLRVKVVSLERKVGDLTLEVRELEAAKASAKAEASRLRVTVEGLRREVRNLKAEKSELEDEISEESGGLRGRPGIASKNLSLVSEMSEAEQQLASARQVTRQLMGQLSSPERLKRQIEELSIENEKLLAELARVKEASLSLVQEDEGGREEDGELQKTVEEDSIDALQQENAELREEVEKQKKANEELRRSLSPVARKGGSSDEEKGALPGSDDSGIAKGGGSGEEDE